MKEETSRPHGGVYAATLTPMKDDLRADLDPLADHCRGLLEKGCDGIVVLGTTGEAVSFTAAERMEIVDALVDSGLPSDRLIVGTGCCAAPDTAALTRHATERGVAGVLVLPPFYYKGVSDEGLFAFFEQVIGQVNDDRLRIFLYHIPAFTGLLFSPSLLKRLIRHFPETVIGIKVSSGDTGFMKDLCLSLPNFQVFAGSERFLVDILEAGGAGCISATANVTSPLAGQVYARWRQEGAGTLQEKLIAVRGAFESHPLVPALKSYLAERTGRKSWLNMRPPLTPLAPEEAAALSDALNALGLDQ